MAQRLATEYVKTSLMIPESEMNNFVRIFAEQQVALQVKVLENGNQDIVLQADEDSNIVLSFEHFADYYKFSGSPRFRNAKTANVMRKALSIYHGDSIVHRIYPHFTMVYEYVNGSVIRIVELSKQERKLVYEYKDTAGRLEHLFLSNQVEEEIRAIKLEINLLLDRRNQEATTEALQRIDANLAGYTHKLFVLEA